MKQKGYKMKELNYLVKLTYEEREYLIRAISKLKESNLNDDDFGRNLWTKFVMLKPYLPSYKKREATIKATEVRSKKAKDKIENAINLLHLENKAITHYSIAKESGVSFNTVKKYIPDIDRIGKF